MLTGVACIVLDHQATTTAFYKGALLGFPLIGVKLSILEELCEFPEVKSLTNRYPILVRLPVLPRCLSPVLLLLYFISAAVVAV